MTTTEKKELITKITLLLEHLLEIKSEEPQPEPQQDTNKPMEMLTVKECAALVDGLSEHTVRQLVKQEKVYAVRAGSGVRGKILVSKASLLKYLGIAS